MVMPICLLLLIFLGTYVKAQAPQPDQCILGCATQVCGELTNLTCFCETGTTQLAACVESDCPASDLTLAIQLPQAYCKSLKLGH